MWVQKFSTTSCLQTPLIHVLLLKCETKFHTHAKDKHHYSFEYFKFFYFRQTGRQKILNECSKHSPDLINVYYFMKVILICS
jgi:hypothetical protein